MKLSLVVIPSPSLCLFTWAHWKRDKNNNQRVNNVNIVFFSFFLSFFFLSFFLFSFFLSFFLSFFFFFNEAYKSVRIYLSIYIHLSIYITQFIFVCRCNYACPIYLSIHLSIYHNLLLSFPLAFLSQFRIHSFHFKGFPFQCLYVFLNNPHQYQ
ncbi:unnamed protein product [Acanthosepion pharaonis]|uniref:Uncharacterized protein n=1 Tax=Acanthosepion pharaonis TaxID=158019 RepID=A0A812BAM6_ACAPH|nr:unnamed protein product [Sepia pharaonis]